MRKSFIIAATFSIALLFAGCSHEKPYGSPVLEIETSLGLEDYDEPGVYTEITGFNSVTLNFNRRIKASESAGHINLYKMNDEIQGESIPITIQQGPSDTTLIVAPVDASQLETGYTYSLNVSTSLRAIDGSFLEDEYTGYFIIIPEDRAGVCELHKSIAVISDIHMGDQRSIDGGYCWFVENKPRLVEFLNYIISKKTVYSKLIIAGDFFDEWVAPMDVIPFADKQGNKLTEQQFAMEIAKANSDIIEMFKKVKAAGVEVIYIPGNHDMLLTTEDFDAIFGKGVITQARDKKGLGRYSAEYSVAIEHGHRYDFYNAPDPISNIGVDGVTKDNAILPAGFFVTKYAATSDQENNTSYGKPQYTYKDYQMEDCKFDFNKYTKDDSFNGFLYDLSGGLIFAQKPVKDFETKPIKTGLCGLTKDYLPKDWTRLENSPILYKDVYMNDVWKNRMAANDFTAFYPFTAGVLAGAVNGIYEYIAFWAYIYDANQRIVVFGHTHEPALEYVITKYGAGLFGIYANAGTWIDQKWNGKTPTCTFVDISCGEGKLNKYKSVNVLKFNGKDASGKPEVEPLYSPKWIYVSQH